MNGNGKKIIGSILSVILLIVLVVGFTYSYFTFVTNGKNIGGLSGNIDIDYSISNSNIEGVWVPSLNRKSSIMESVTAKLNADSISSKLNIYLTPTFISGIPKGAIMWEVDVLDTESNLLEHYSGDLSTSQVNSSMKIVDSYVLTNDLITFNIYLWLNGEIINNDNFSPDSNGFTAIISADTDRIKAVFE